MFRIISFLLSETIFNLIFISTFVSNLFHLFQNKINITEEEIIQLFQHDSKDAISVLYDKYSSSLYGVIFKIVGNEETAQDILQDTFVNIWKNLSSYDSEKGRLFTWMLNIARNRSIDFIRSKKRKNESNTSQLLGDLNIEDHSSEIKIDSMGLTDVLLSLGTENREAIEIVYFKGCTHEEAAEQLGIPLGTLKSRVRNGLIKLRAFVK